MRFFKSLSLASALVLGLAAAGCGDDSDDSDDDATTEDTSEDASPSASGTGEAAVTILSPEDGAEVSSPVAFSLETEGVEIQAVDDWDGEQEGVGHYHILVDYGGCYEVGESIPTEAEDQGIYHFGDGSTEPEIEDLEPGEHEACVQVADPDHVGMDLTAELSFTVTE